jgi:copper chaperone CopZ
MVRPDLKAAVVGALAVLLSFASGRRGNAFLLPIVRATKNVKPSPTTDLLHAVHAARPLQIGQAASEIEKPGENKGFRNTWTAASKRFLASSFNIESYHLLWSPGSWRKLLAGTTTLFLAHYLGNAFAWTSNTYGMNHLTQQNCHSTIKSVAINLVIPLLASACCVLQLAMNVLSIGCAGFNKTLGPVRPYFMSILLYLTYIGWNARPNASMTSRLATIMLRWSVALLPEVLDVYNRRGALHTASSVPPNRNWIATVQLDIPTMGCVACVKSVNNALRRLPGVEQAASSLNDNRNGGQAQVRIAADSENDVNAVVATLQAAVADAGFFGSEIDSVHVLPNPQPVRTGTG